MLTRAPFLATGLVPVTTQNEDCCICTDGMISPVQLSCKHTYCNSCIQSWLSQPGKNSCPTCRCILFSLPASEQLVPFPDRRAQVNRAAARLYQEPAAIVDADFIDSTVITQASLDRANAAARAYLSFNHSIMRSGIFTFDQHFLQANIVAMGNLLPGLAAVEDRPYSPVHAAEWKTILHFLGELFVNVPHAWEFESRTFVERMRVTLKRHMETEGHDVHRWAAFDPSQPVDDSPRGDLTIILKFLVHVSFSRQEEIEREQRAAEQQMARQAQGKEKICSVM